MLCAPESREFGVKSMIVDAFLSWSKRASPQARVSAADALARAYLNSALNDEDRGKVATGLFVLLDDPTTAVRRKLADVFAASVAAPRSLVLKLVDDVPAVSTPLYASSVHLRAGHLIEGLQRRSDTIDAAIGARRDLSAPLIAHIVSNGSRNACLALARNRHIRWTDQWIDQFIGRFADDSEVMDHLAEVADLDAVQVCGLIAARADAYASSGLVRAFIPEDRLKRVTQKSRERALVDYLDRLGGADTVAAVQSLHPKGLVTPTLTLRLALGGSIPPLEALLACLCNTPVERVRAAMIHARPAAAAALLNRSSLDEEVRAVVSMAFVLARELAKADVTWTAGFFATTLIEVVDQRFGAMAGSEFAENSSERSMMSDASDAVLGLCHSIAADIEHDEALSEAHRLTQAYKPQPEPLAQVHTDELPALDQAITEGMQHALAA